MIVLGLNPGHSGAAALIVDGELVLSYEAEKDSFERFGALGVDTLIEVLAEMPSFPDVVAVGGWHKVNLLPNMWSETRAGYFGLEPGEMREGALFGRPVRFYSSSHERSHVVAAVATSPFEPETDLAVLVWEGLIGAFYLWRGSRQGSLTRIPILDQPGARYAALFALANPNFPDRGGVIPNDYAGKLMAIAGYADEVEPAADSQHVVESLLRRKLMYPFDKHAYRRSGLYNRGVEDPEVARAARHLSDAIYSRFLLAAETELPQGLPLAIAGGCGLNCEWNTRFRGSGYFSDVWVPPCADDSGSALGTAVDAAVQAGASSHVTWSVYSGPQFVYDCVVDARVWAQSQLDFGVVARALNEGAVVAWVDGRCEIGPRALGHRSLLASAANRDSRDALNRMKGREGYRPIAPVCRESDLNEWFDDATPDPYMLFFRRVRSPERIPAVAHIDGTARVQSVTRESGPRIYELLNACEALGDPPVLCNTSLNFRGRGFINRMSDLVRYCDEAGISHIVIDDQHLVRTHRQSGA